MRFVNSTCCAVLVFLGMNCGQMVLGQGPVKLNGPLVADGDVVGDFLQFSPDSSVVLYLADQDVFEDFEIYIVSSGGGVTLNLNGVLVVGGDVAAAQFSPNSNRVLYRADQDVDELFEIFSVPSTGGAATQLNAALVAGGDVSTGGLQFSPDGTRVLYHADQDVDGLFEIFSVPSAGGAATQLNAALVAGGDVSSGGLQFSPDGTRVLYHADQDADEVFEIYSVPNAGGAAVKLNGTLVAGGNVSTGGLQFSPDGTRVLYHADQDADGVFEIYSVPGGGGAAVKLNGTLVAGGDVLTGGLQFSPDGSLVLYLANQDSAGVNEIYSVPSTGGTAVKLNHALGVDGVIGFPYQVSPNGLQFSPDGSRVLYLTDHPLGNGFPGVVTEIYSVPSTGGTAVKLNGPLVLDGDVSSSGLQFSPDGSRVIYVADQDINERFELYSVASDGGTPVKLNGPLLVGGDVNPFNSPAGVQFNPDGSRVLYQADQDTNEVFEIYIVPSAGGMPLKVNGPLVTGGDVNSPFESGYNPLTGVQFSPDGSRVLYWADQDVDGVTEIYSRVVRLHAEEGSGGWDAGATWDQGVVPDEVMQVFIDAPGSVTAVGSATARTVNELQIDGGTGTSTLALQANAVINALHGVTIEAGGVLRGDGQINALDADIVNVDGGKIVNADGGEVQVGGGERLEFNGTSFENAGLVDAIGGSGNLAEIVFEVAVTNSGADALIAGRNAILRFRGGLTNEAALAFPANQGDVFGDVTNTGTIVVSGGAVTTFYDDVTQNGTLRVSKVGSTASAAVFLGAFSGSGGSTGGGDIFFEGDLRPGNSPATVNFGNNITFGPGATLEIELAGTVPGTQYDQVHVAGSLSLDGILAVLLIDGFAPDAGDSFDILDWGSLTGTFDTLQLPAISAGLVWNASQLYTTGVLSVALAGDYNFDGTVDAADYVVWRKNDGTPEGYNAWRANFGQTAGSGSLLAAELPAVVPEPNGLLLLAGGGMLLGVAAWGGRRRSQVLRGSRSARSA